MPLLARKSLFFKIILIKVILLILSVQNFFSGKGKKLFSVAPTSAVINEKKLFIAKCRVLNVIRGNIGFYRVDTLTQVNNNRTNNLMPLLYNF